MHLSISQRIRSWLQEGEDILTSLLGLIIAISGLIAFADVFSNGKAIGSLPWLLWAWIIAQAVSVDYQFYITVKRQFRGASVDRFVYWTRWALIAVLGALIVFVGAIFVTHETQGGAVAVSMTVLGIPSIAFMYVRAASPVLLLFVIAADHALDRNEKPVEAPTTVGMDDETVQLILSKLAKLDALEQALNAQVMVSEDRAETPLQLPETTETFPETTKMFPETSETFPETDHSHEQLTPLGDLFPSVSETSGNISETEKQAVIEAYEQGIQRRDICGYLHWGAGKYKTIVKPVLDALETQKQQRNN